VIHVTGLRHAGRRMNQQVGILLPGGLQRHVKMRLVHRIAGLKSNHPSPTPPPKQGPQLLRSVPQPQKVVMRRQVQALDRSAHVKALLRRLGLAAPYSEALMMLMEGRERQPLHQDGPDA